MAFVNQVSAANFVPQKIKVLKVLCQECIQEMGTSTRAVTLTSTPSLNNIKVLSVKATGEPEITDIAVTDTKVINQGFVPVAVTFAIGQTTQPVFNTTATFQGEVECPGLSPSEIVNVQKHDLQVVNVSAVPVQIIGNILSFEITVTIKGCVIISKEAILKVNAATMFCTCS